MPKKNRVEKRPKVHIEFKGFLSFLILHELNINKKLCGSELAELIGKRKGAKLTAGTIYPALKRLRKLKLIVHRKDGRKKHYKLTDTGKKEIKKLYKIFGMYFNGLKGKIRK